MSAPTPDPDAVECHEGVTRGGEFQPCEKPAVARRIDEENGGTYPVCIHHTRKPMMPLPHLAPGQSEADLVAMLTAQREWSLPTFGPGDRLAGILAHLRSELEEVEAAPTDVTEWIDVVILALDGAWRAGHEPAAIVEALQAKYARNRARRWPDWRTADPDAPIEHVRTAPAEDGAE